MKVNPAVVVPLLAAVVAGAFALWQAKIADRRAKDATSSANTTKTIELGVTDLINQYREANEELRDEIHELNNLRTSLESDMRVMRAEVNEVRNALEHCETEKDNLQAEIVRLKIKAGEDLT